MLGALFSWIQKTGYALAFFCTGVVLSMTGFNASLGGHQASSTLTEMRLSLAGSTALWAVSAIVLLAFYPLTKARAYQTRDALEARRGPL
jgi:GPH family glycoside/pentoside/hexuronide:cation symporter